MTPAIRQLPGVALLRLLADGRAKQLSTADWPGEYEALSIEQHGHRFLLVGEPLWRQLLAKSVAHEESQKSNELTLAKQEALRLRSQMAGLLTILKNKLAPDERIPDAAWELLHGGAAYVAEETNEEAQPEI